MENEKKDRSKWVVRVARMEDVADEEPHYTPEEGFAAVWPLTIQAWMMKSAASENPDEKFDVQSRLQRHVHRIIRPQG
jgi:hypothetical protein